MVCPKINAFVKNKHKIGNTIVLTTIAAVFASLGLLLNNVYLLVGSMLISPVLSPVTYLFYDKRTLINSMYMLRTLSILVAISVIIGYFSANIYKNKEVELLNAVPLIESTTELEGRTDTKVLLYSFIIAVVCGILYINTMRGGIEEDKGFLGEMLILGGLGITISVLPPLTACGIFIERGDFDSSYKALLLFIVNVIGFIIGGFLQKMVECM